MATARRKLQRLLDEEVIQIGAIINPVYMGYRTIVSIGINVVPGQADAVAEQLEKHPNVHFCSICIGRADIIIWALFKEQQELNTFLKDEIARSPAWSEPRPRFI